MRGRQRYRCLDCGRQFIPPRDKTALRRELWQQYIWHRQTLDQLGERYRHSGRWVRQQLDAASVIVKPTPPQPIVAVADTTFFGRGYGILVVRCPRLKKNVHFHEVSSETPAEYALARAKLEARGFTILAAVVDGKRGVQGVFRDIPVQLCQFHQIAIVRRYVTSRPKLPAGRELRAIALAITTLTEQSCQELLKLWHERWHEFLKERTLVDNGERWHFTHRRIRSAYRSLATNLPYLFTYQKYPTLHIPNTTNSVDGFFSKLKQLLNTHRGLTTERRYKLIQEILGR